MHPWVIAWHCPLCAVQPRAAARHALRVSVYVFRENFSSCVYLCKGRR